MLLLIENLIRADWFTQFTPSQWFAFVVAICPALSPLWSHVSVTPMRRTWNVLGEMPQVAWGHELCVLWASDLNNTATVLPRKAGKWTRASWTQLPQSRPKGCKWARRKAGRWVVENVTGGVLSQGPSKCWTHSSSKFAKYPKEQTTHF